MGCLLSLSFIFFILGFFHPWFWVFAVVMLLNAIGSSSSSSQPSSSSQTASKNLEIVPDDLDNILQSLSEGEIKDPVTQETFKPGQKVYLCRTHRLAYHEDSWESIGRKCTECGHDRSVRHYILPTPIQIPAKKQANELIQWEDLE